MTWTAAQMPRLGGRVAVVTGGTSGLGRATATELARHGARVMLACRDIERGKQAADDIRNRVPDADIEVRHIDLADMTSVREFGEGYEGPLHLLINNHAETWFAYLIVFGEIAVGLGLIFGVLTGIAAFFGATMNMSFLLAGSASTNPVLFTLAVGLILAWRVAGYYGFDRYLLPRLGVPWKAHVAVHQAAPTMGSPMTA